MKKVDLSKYNISWYVPATKFKRIIWYFTNLLFFKNSFFTSISIKKVILKLFGAKIGLGFVIKNNVNIKYPWNLIIGDNCWIGEDVWIDNLDFIYFEDNVCISQGAMLLCGNHDYKSKNFDLLLGKIILKEGAWVGAKSVVCPGVTLNSHSVLSLGSVANRDLESYFIYQGIPAKKHKLRVIK